ncbi:MAG: LysR substrate-binding domain-containing protein, partial [Shewanella sp.]
ILAALMQEVPGMVPEIWNKDQQGLEALALGKLDFVILPHDQSQPPFQQAGLTWLPLRREKLVCLLRHDHPALREPWHLDTYLSWRHIAIRDNELANPFFEQHLAQQRVHRQIGAVLPDFASAAALLPHSDLILTALAGWAENMAKHSTLALRAAPFEYGHISYSLVFCEPQREGSAMAWFKKRFVSLATQLTP